jgi:hypothetical protein
MPTSPTSSKVSSVTARQPPKLATKSATKSSPAGKSPTTEAKGVTMRKTIKPTSSLSEATPAPTDGANTRKKPRKLERRGGTTADTREALTLHHPDGTRTTTARSDKSTSVIPSPTPSPAKPPPKRATGVPGKVAGAATAGVGGVAGTADRLAGGATGAVEGLGKGLLGTVGEGAGKALPSGELLELPSARLRGGG